MTRPQRWQLSLVVQCACTALVALGAAYASYRHGRTFALRFGADATTAAIWPLIVDGLLTIATVELWTAARDSGRRIAWTAFGFGISLSLCANIGSTDNQTVFGIIVAASPPLALLLAVELLNRAFRHRRDAHSEIEQPAAESLPRLQITEVSGRSVPTAEQRMWEHYTTERAHGRTPTGAELDRVANTHNYGRRVLRHWRASGRLDELHVAGTPRPRDLQFASSD